jgi:hypothetical protein
MFDFKRVETGSAERYPTRVKKHLDLYGISALHHWWWVVHNCVSHPMIGILPIKPFFEFHDWTSKKINAGD